MKKATQEIELLFLFYMQNILRIDLKKQGLFDINNYIFFLIKFFVLQSFQI